VGYPEDRDRAEERLDELTADDDAESSDTEEVTVDG
jgi:hypothetical protein